MPIFKLSHEIVFPPVELSTAEGILATGGDLSPERLISAYKSGIFPWYMPESPILWWSPDPRFVLFTDELIVPGSMRRVFNNKNFSFTFDTCFEEVIRSCSLPRKGENSTWLVPEMIEAYITLNKLGYAHSVEAWSGSRLSGGLYGVSLGRCFFGESMFTRESNASKAALIFLSRRLKSLGFNLIDSQVYTPHLAMLGARLIPRPEYLSFLKESLKFDGPSQKDWKNLPGSNNGNNNPGIL
ncbi:MAG: leucyl/phenylalanyl-tRNA--protein transferase [Brevinematales bacterium]